MRAVHADAVVTGDARDRPRRGRRRRRRAARCVAVGRRRRRAPAARRASRSSGSAGSSCPGLVNAHTHLELSALRGRVAGRRGVRAVGRAPHRRCAPSCAPRRTPTRSTRAVDELDAAGTVAVGEVTNSLAAVGPLARRGLRRLRLPRGLRRRAGPARAARGRSAARSSRSAWAPGRARDLAYAPTPHTLYTTHPDVVRRLLRDARESAAPARALHLAEHAAERRFLEHGDGPIADWYESRLKLRRDLARVARAVARRPSRTTSGALGPSVLAVHLTDARPEELELVARRGAPVVLCPRSNLLHRDAAPAAARRTRGRHLPALGTDSLASNASLDVLAEARALADRFSDGPRARSSCAWRRGRAPARSGATTSGASRAARARGSSRSTGTSGADACAFVLAQRPRRRADGSSARPLEELVMTVLARIRTYGSLVAFAHTVFALPFAASAVVLSLARPHAPLGPLARRRDARVHGVRAHRARWPSTAGPTATSTRATRARGAATSPRAPCDPARRSRWPSSPASRFLAFAATLGFWPAVLAPAVLARAPRLLVRQALHVGRARVARRCAVARAGRRVARDGRRAAAPGIVLLMAAVVTWLLGFDVLYSLQDETFDRDAGLHSIPARFGTRRALAISAARTSSPSLALAGVRPRAPPRPGLRRRRRDRRGAARLRARARSPPGPGGHRPGLLRRQRLGQRRLLRARAGRRARCAAFWSPDGARGSVVTDAPSLAVASRSPSLRSSSCLARPAADRPPQPPRVRLARDARVPHIRAVREPQVRLLRRRPDASSSRRPADADGRGQPFELGSQGAHPRVGHVRQPADDREQLYGDWTRRDGITFKTLAMNTWVVRGRRGRPPLLHAVDPRRRHHLTVEVSYDREVADVDRAASSRAWARRS